MSKGQTLQEPFLNALRKERVPVSIFLVNGIKLQGQIESFDQFVVLQKQFLKAPAVSPFPQLRILLTLVYSSCTPLLILDYTRDL